MSYSEWADFVYYDVGGIASYNGIVYQALLANRGVVPTGLAPNWAVLASGAGVSSLNTLTGAITIDGAKDGTHSPSIIVDKVGQEVAIYTKVLSQYGFNTIAITSATTLVSITLPEPYLDNSYSTFISLQDPQNTAPSWTNIVQKTVGSFQFNINSTDGSGRSIAYSWGTLGLNVVVPI